MYVADQRSRLPFYRAALVAEPRQREAAQPRGSASELGKAVLKRLGSACNGQLLRSTKARTFSRAASRISGPCVKAATE